MLRHGNVSTCSSDTAPKTASNHLTTREARASEIRHGRGRPLVNSHKCRRNGTPELQDAMPIQ